MIQMEDGLSSHKISPVSQKVNPRDQKKTAGADPMTPGTFDTNRLYAE